MPPSPTWCGCWRASFRETGLLAVLFGFVLIGMGIWAYGRWNAPGASAGRARFGKVACVVLIVAGAWTGWPVASKPTDIVWDKWSTEAVDKLRSENRIVYVDFTARWCATCQANKRLVFHSDEVLRVFRDKNIATLRGDWTNKDPLITAELAKYQRAAGPVQCRLATGAYGSGHPSGASHPLGRPRGRFEIIGTRRAMAVRLPSVVIWEDPRRPQPLSRVWHRPPW